MTPEQITITWCIVMGVVLVILAGMELKEEKEHEIQKKTSSD